MSSTALIIFIKPLRWVFVDWKDNSKLNVIDSLYICSYLVQQHVVDILSEVGILRVSTTTKMCHFLSFFLLGHCLSVTTHSSGDNKSTSDNGAPKQRSRHAMTTGWPLALLALLSLRPAIQLWCARSEIIWSCGEHMWVNMFFYDLFLEM